LKTFPGFTDSETFTSIPDSFFKTLLNEIADAEELRVTLYALWRIAHMEGHVHALRSEDFTSLLPKPEAALKKSVERGSLLAVEREGQNWYFLNSPRGRAAAQAFAAGEKDIPVVTSSEPREKPNIFKLYEENIGALTPLMADALKDAEATFPAEWMQEAMEIAVKSNKRNWKYVEAILNRWKEEGHGQEQDRRDAQEPRGRDVTRKVEDFLKR
jgi:DNA replication protein